MLGIALATLRHQTRRLLAPLLAVALGVGFLTATGVFASTAKGSLTEHVAGTFTELDLVAVPKGVTPGSATDLASGAEMAVGLPDRLAALDGVESVHAQRGALDRVVAGGKESVVGLYSTPEGSTTVTLASGRWAKAPDEVALTSTLARTSGLAEGDELSIGGHTLRVVGIADGSKDTRYVGMPGAFTTPAGITALTGHHGWTEIDVVVAPDADAATVRAAVQRAAGDQVDVRTGAETAHAVVDDLGSSTDAMGLMLQAFAVIALVVSAMVIGNTFAILLARRRRETAMLRAVGASRGQVVRSAVVEGCALGLVGGVVGTLAGVALTAGLVRLLDASGVLGMPFGLHLGVAQVLVPVVVGVIAVVVSVLRPALAASRVSPLEAMSPVATPEQARRAGRVRTVGGVVLSVVGLAALVVGATGASLAPALTGGVLSFLGVVLLAPVVLPPLAVGIARLVAPRSGVAGELAREHVRRNPGRAAATAMALLVGVTLVTMTTTAAATAQRSVLTEIDSSYPVDGIVAGSDDRIPAAALDELRAVDAVDEVSVLSGGTVRVDGRSLTVVAADGRLADVVHDGTLVTPVPAGSVHLDEATARSFGMADGETVTLGRKDLTVDVTPVPTDGALVAAADLAAVVPDAAPRTALIRLDPDVAVDEASTQVAEALSDHPEVSWTSAAQERSQLEDSLAIAVAVVLGMLAMSVLIAIVGIANTLSLSVHERSRESALMRALGLSRRALRRVVALEAVLMALTATLVGTLLGIGYGLAGAAALLGGEIDVLPALPWWQLGAVAVVALLAALAASVLPAARASRVSPAEALAAD